MSFLLAEVKIKPNRSNVLLTWLREMANTQIASTSWVRGSQHVNLNIHFLRLIGRQDSLTQKKKKKKKWVSSFRAGRGRWPKGATCYLWHIVVYLSKTFGGWKEYLK